MKRPVCRTSIGGVTTGNGWLYNNPDLGYPEGHESMAEAELMEALKSDFVEELEMNNEHSGWYWICPDCDNVNNENSGSVGTVECGECGEDFELGDD